jgi:tetratricopeptide (TPR) repeat protein
MRRRLLALSIGLASFFAASVSSAQKLPEFSEAKRLYAARDYARAADKLRAAVAKSPGQARVHYLLGLAQTKLGQFAEAEQSRREAQRLDPAIGFTSKAKFEKKLGRARTLASAASPSAVDAPRPATPTASPAPRLQAAPSADADGPPLWSLILLGVCGAFLAVSFVRQALRPVR